MASVKSTALVAALLLMNTLCIQSMYISGPAYGGYPVITDNSDDSLDTILPFLLLACTGRGGFGYGGCGNGGCGYGGCGNGGCGCGYGSSCGCSGCGGGCGGCNSGCGGGCGTYGCC